MMVSLVNTKVRSLASTESIPNWLADAYIDAIALLAASVSHWPSSLEPILR
jgi:hypothetical protein